MFLMPVFAASVRALVTPVMMGISIWGHQVQMVSQSLSVSGESATWT